MYKAPDEGEAFGAWKDEAVGRRDEETSVIDLRYTYADHA